MQMKNCKRSRCHNDGKKLNRKDIADESKYGALTAEGEGKQPQISVKKF